MFNAFSSSSERRLIHFDGGPEFGSEVPKTDTKENLKDLKKDVEITKEKEVAEKREERVRHWLKPINFNDELEAEKNETNDKSREHFRIYKKATQFREKALICEIASKGENENSVLQEGYRQWRVLNQLRSWLRESEPDGFSSDDYDIGSPKDAPFATLTHGIYDKNGNFIGNVRGCAKHFVVQPDRGEDLSNVSNVDKNRFILDTWPLIQDYERKQDKKK